MKKLLILFTVAIMATGALAENITVTSGKITIGSTDYTMSKVDGVSPDTYVVTIPLEAGNYSAHCTLNETKTTNATAFSLKEAKDVTFWGRFPSGKTWVALLTNAAEYGIMNDKWRYWFLSKPNYDAADPGVSISYFNAYSSGYTFQAGNGSKSPSDEYIITANASGNPPFTIVKTSTSAGIKKATLTYAEWKVEAEEATSLPVTIGPAGAATIVAPADLTIPSGIRAYTLKYNGADALVATEVKTTIPANTPVLLNGNQGGYEFVIDAKTTDIHTDNYAETIAPYMPDVTSTENDLYGVLQPHYVPVNAYVLQNGDGGVGFYKVADVTNYRINPFRAYLKLPAAAPSRLTIIYDEDAQTTGIKATKTEFTGDAATYNLAGQRVGSDFKGVVVKNGRKTIQK